MKAVEIVKGVYWVGAIDWNLRDYHGNTLPGTTYNAYLVINDGLGVHYKPTEDDLARCAAMGRELGVKMRAM